MTRFFSWRRFRAVLNKEFIQMKRDQLTFGMIIGIPLIQLILFGFAINTNPKHLPTVIISQDHSAYTRQFVTALQNTNYFKIINSNTNEKNAGKMLANGRAQFVINIPNNFTRDIIRGEQPSLLVSVDATDPAATSAATGALNTLASNIYSSPNTHGLPSNIQGRKPDIESTSNPESPFNLIIHSNYNPESISQYNIVPGLMGVTLTMTMIMITALAITRERERKTMEMLLSTPVRPIEVMLGKIMPYIIVGYIQMLLIFWAGLYLFNIPNLGSGLLLFAMTLPFIVANLSVGLTFSTIAKNQLQAIQMTFFFFLPSLLLSGFMFPFYGMPQWAQWLGNVLPLTHYVRIVRGIILKGNGFEVLWTDLWPIIAFMVIALAVGLKRYRQTLD